MPGALAGIKVLEVATTWAAPGAAMYLADQGAEVIKVESPLGDEARRQGLTRAVRPASEALHER